jgi:hypothetical protein
MARSMTISLILPIVLSAIVLFFLSFLSWMVVQLHQKDWLKMKNEDQFLEAARGCGLEPGSYMFPGCNAPAEAQTEEHRKKWEAGPRGVMTLMGMHSMESNLGQTFVYFFVASFCLAYLTTLALKPGADFMTVFRFVSTASFMTFFAAIVPHAIWFKCRITGHLIESIVYAAAVGAIFGAMWPGA